MFSVFQAGRRENPFEALSFPAVDVKEYNLQKTFKGHMLSVSNLALHPSKAIVVTASDDKTWKMWHLPKGDLILSGEGHKDWVAGLDFHPQVALLPCSYPTLTLPFAFLFLRHS